MRYIGLGECENSRERGARPSLVALSGFQPGSGSTPAGMPANASKMLALPEKIAR